MLNIIKRPIINEKFTARQKDGVYGFEVDKDADKFQIRAAVEKMFGVKVEKVNTMNVRGKAKSRFVKGKAMTGKTAAYKKAIVYLQKDEVIDFYANI
jgi:large subunit ribosomal protein L23